MPECRRRIMVDGKAAARQARDGAFPVELRTGSRRQLSASKQSYEPYARSITKSKPV